MLAARRNFMKVTKVIVPNLCLLSLFPFSELETLTGLRCYKGRQQPEPAGMEE